MRIQKKSWDMKQRVGLEMPMVGLVLKNGKTICGVPCGFESEHVPTEDPSKKDYVQYIMFPWVKVSCNDIDEVLTYDERGEPHRVKVDGPVSAQIHLWFLNKEFKKA